ncbi:MAG: hypothetical protein NBKEAIPA_03689 [Nitrospirae bacterium]|nr:hypothetical protein [Nitrospirota bacterium]
MTAQIEKVVLDTDGVPFQHITPNPGHNLFRGRGRSHEPSTVRPLTIRFRQSAAIHLAIGRQGQGRQNGRSRRHHVIGQLRTEKVLDHPALPLRSRPDQIGREEGIALVVLAYRHDGILHGWMLPQNRFDLPQFDPEPSNLHLMVHPT